MKVYQFLLVREAHPRLLLGETRVHCHERLYVGLGVIEGRALGVNLARRGSARRKSWQRRTARRKSWRRNGLLGSGRPLRCTVCFRTHAACKTQEEDVSIMD